MLPHLPGYDVSGAVDALGDGVDGCGWTAGIAGSPCSEDAFFPRGADDTLADVLMDAGWSVGLEEGDYLWTGVHPASEAVIHYVEGDVYCPMEGRVA